ncbi:MAG: HlyC/CorC family transporter [Rhodospirillales bacterium]|nr:HlyC/CorC family transporter [Rhodospirillales bacterium]
MRLDSENSSVTDTAQSSQDDSLEGRSARERASVGKKNERPGLLSRLKFLFTGKTDNGDGGLREVIEEYIVEPEGFNTDSVSTHERLLLSNILKLRDVTVVDVMIPRADIVAIDIDIEQDALYELLSELQFSRLPVYQDTLDDVLGTVHVKDIVTHLAKGQDIRLKELITEIPIVSPSMPILDLVLKMRHSRRHMALVVDEFGGIDGLVTIGDVIESIIGEIEDEHDTQDEPQILEAPDGSVIADARVELGEFESQCGSILSEEDREDSDTLGGLVFDLAGRVPARGEVITHSSGMTFEILDADPRRINRVKITHIPQECDLAEAGE